MHNCACQFRRTKPSFCYLMKKLYGCNKFIRFPRINLVYKYWNFWTVYVKERRVKNRLNSIAR